MRAQGVWRPVAPMAAGRAYGAAAALDGVVYALGGMRGPVRALAWFCGPRPVQTTCWSAKVGGYAVVYVVYRACGGAQ